MRHSLFEEITSLENLFLAFQEFKKGKNKKPDVQLFEHYLEDNIFSLYCQLKTKTYQHSHYTSFYIKDPKLREIHKAVVKDRVLHHALFRVLYPVFDKTFIADSYSCRLAKGTHKAINRLEKFALRESQNKTKNIFILKCDIKKFFGSIDHDILISLLKKKIQDQDILFLLKGIIQNFKINKGKGLPLGNITSQLFANVCLNELDQFIKHSLKIKHYVRYCDDFVVLSQNKSYLENTLVLIDNFLQANLKLFLHLHKIEIRKWHQGVDFLGYVSFPRYRLLRKKTKKRMFFKIKTKYQLFLNNEISQEKFEQTLKSYCGHLEYCASLKIKGQIDQLLLLGDNKA